MRFLRKIILAICFIVLLACLKILFRKIFPGALIFHYNLFSSLQLLLLLWAILTASLESTVWKKETPARSRRKSFVFFLAFLLLAEGGCIWLLHHPRSIPRPLLSAFRYYYNNYQRDILQYNKNISHYDAALFYRMNANNRSVFSNIEFTDSVFTDSSGFRDNRSAAGKPQIVCLGDSYTLGWGAQQDDAYPVLLEDILGKPVLNTGMSSYGTAREAGSLPFIDSTDVSAIVIQYCNNDAGENQAFVDDHFHLTISPRSSYDSAVGALRWSKLYFPGKYFCTITEILLEQSVSKLTNLQPSNPQSTSLQPSNPQSSRFQPGPQPGSYDREAAWFIEVLRHSGWNIGKTQIFVFDICDYQDMTEKFVDALDKRLATPDDSLLFKGHLHVLHIKPLLTAQDYYILDEHLRPSGTYKLARYVAGAINALQP
jgi:hypothetical protein